MVFGIKTDSDQRAVKWEIRNKKREVMDVSNVWEEKGRIQTHQGWVPSAGRWGEGGQRCCVPAILNFLNTSWNPHKISNPGYEH